VVNLTLPTSQIPAQEDLQLGWTIVSNSINGQAPISLTSQVGFGAIFMDFLSIFKVLDLAGDWWDHRLQLHQRPGAHQPDVTDAT
jgi:hypothetical protein